MTPERFLTLQEFAQLVRVGESTVYEWIKKGVLKEELHYRRFGGLIRIPWPLPPLERKRKPAPKEDRPRCLVRPPSGSVVNLEWGK